MHLRFIVIFFALYFMPIIAHSQNDGPKKVLFVGNSYTYFWNLPQNVSLMATDQGINIETAQSTVGGTTWAQHWRGEKGLETRSRIGL